MVAPFRPIESYYSNGRRLLQSYIGLRGKIIARHDMAGMREKLGRFVVSYMHYHLQDGKTPPFANALAAIGQDVVCISHICRVLDALATIRDFRLQSAPARWPLQLHADLVTRAADNYAVFSLAKIETAIVLQKEIPQLVSAHQNLVAEQNRKRNAAFKLQNEVLQQAIESAAKTLGGKKEIFEKKGSEATEDLLDIVDTMSDAIAAHPVPREVSDYLASFTAAPADEGKILQLRR